MLRVLRSRTFSHSLGRFEPLLGGRHRSQSHLAQVPPADLDDPIPGPLPPPGLPLGDPLEARSLEVVGFDAPLGYWRSGSSRWNTRRGSRTIPWYSPISTPNFTACLLGIPADVLGG